VKTQADYDIGLRVRKEQVGAISEQEINRRLGARDESKGGVDQAKAALEQAQLYYDWCKVLAPIDGRADRHFVDIGNLITQDVTALTNIVSLKPTWAYFDIDENTVRKYQRLVAKGDIKTPRATEVPVQMALGDDPDFPLEGYIDFLGNQLDPNTGSIRARAVFPNKEGTLAAGMFGRIRVPSNEPHKALLVLDSAIGTDQGQKFVYVVNVQNQVEYRPVDVGQMHGTLREVNRYRTVVEAVPDGQDERRRVEVLLPADRVIVEGVQRVRPGATVDPKLVDMTTLLAQPVEAAAAPSASGSASKPRAAEK
jgi:RND family efflux transporter MFP subunit